MICANFIYKVIFSFLVVTSLVTPNSYAKKKQVSGHNEMLLLFDVQGEQAFGFKQKKVKGKNEYFLTFKRGKQTYQSTLIPRATFNNYKRVIENTFENLPTKRNVASVDSCHKQIQFIKPKDSAPQILCFHSLPTSKQAKIRSILSSLNKKLYGVSGHDLI